MRRAGKLTVLACAIFLTIATYHQTNIFKNDLTIHLDSDDLQVDKSISDVDIDNHQRKYWKKVKRGKKGIKYLNELNGKDVNHCLFNLKQLTISWKSIIAPAKACWAVSRCIFLNLSISENYQFPEVEPEECVRTSEGDI